MTPRSVNRWSKVFQAILKHAKSFNKEEVRLVGEDHLGNKYFEAQRPNHIRPVQRFYNRSKKLENFDDIIDSVHVPPAWDAWLRFRKQEPPSELEVLESEEYFRMQQEMASSKKKEQQEGKDSQGDSDPRLCPIAEKIPRPE